MNSGGALRAVFCPVGLWDEHAAADRTAFQVPAPVDLRFQRPGKRQDRPAEPLTADGERNHLRAGAGVPLSLIHISMTFEQRRMWEDFLSGEEKGIPGDLPTAKRTEPDDKLMNMSGFSVRFSGKIDVNMISNSLISILGNDSVGEVEIKCNLVNRMSDL